MELRNFGTTLRAFRSAKNLPRDSLAARLAGKYACDSIIVGEWETGQRKHPRESVVALVAQALNLSREETDALLLSAGYKQDDKST